jgi:hypothetical protein
MSLDLSSDRISAASALLSLIWIIFILTFSTPSSLQLPEKAFKKANLTGPSMAYNMAGVQFLGSSVHREEKRANPFLSITKGHGHDP